MKRCQLKILAKGTFLPEGILCILRLYQLSSHHSLQMDELNIFLSILAKNISSGRTDIYFIHKSRRKDVARFPENTLALKMTEIITSVACII